MRIPGHSVVAYLRGGPAEQPVDSARRSIALFDRLRRLFPHVRFARLQSGRVVEIHQP